MPGYVGGTTTTNAGTAGNPISITYSPTSGNFVVVVGKAVGGVTGNSCVDNNSNALIANPSNNVTCFMFYGIAKTGASSYTVTMSSSSKASLIIGEYTLQSGTGATTNGGTTSTNPTVSLVTTAINSWVIAALGSGSFITYTSNTGILRNQINGGTGNSNSLCLVDSSSIPLASVTCIVSAVSSTWLAVALELKAQTFFTAPGIDTQFHWGGGDGW